jgi:hypothetical protein
MSLLSKTRQIVKVPKLEGELISIKDILNSETPDFIKTPPESESK